MIKYMFVAPGIMVKKELRTEQSSMCHYVSKLKTSIEECEEELVRVVGSTGYTDMDYYGYHEESLELSEKEWEEKAIEAGSPVKVNCYMVSDFEEVDDVCDDSEFLVGIYAIRI